MARPDFETEQGRAEYRRELRRVGWQFRAGGLVMIVVAALVVIGASRNLWGLNESLVTVGYVMLGLGWVLYLAAIFQRTRYHRRRMAEGL